MIEYYKNLSLESLFYINENGLVCQEEWRDIPDYEGHYKVSNVGRIKSIKKNKIKIMKIQMNTHGYNSICLCKNGKIKTFAVHILIGNVFLNYNDFDSKKFVIDHIDNVSTNCVIYNLQIITIRENSTKDKKNKTSKYCGVNWYPQTNKWQSGIIYNKKRIHLGYFNTEEEAKKFYDDALQSIINREEIKRKLIKPASKYKGVFQYKKSEKWRSAININGKTIHLGVFDDELDAKNAYDTAFKNKNSLNI